MGLKSLLYSLALAMALIVNGPAFAHKVVMAAYAEGDIVEGEVGFSSGDMAANAPVEVLDPEGTVIGNTTTDSDGIFHYKPTKAIPLTFRADLGQGHVAIYTMPLDELPEIAGDVDADGIKTDHVASDGDKAGAIAGTFTDDRQALALAPDQLGEQVRAIVKQELAKAKSEIASAIRKDIKPLRKEIAAYKEKNDLQTILGGIGYIVGLFGLGFYFAARKEKQAAEKLKSAKSVS